MNTDEDRLDRIEKLLEKKKRGGSQLCWLKYNPIKTYKYDIINAEEDVAWMVYELKRLRAENEHYREFIDALRTQMVEELGLPHMKRGNPPDL